MPELVEPPELEIRTQWMVEYARKWMKHMEQAWAERDKRLRGER
jgi:hypothetical protein